MQLYHRFIAQEKLRRLCVLLFIIFTLFFLKEFITLILLTFIFIYLMIRLDRLIHRWMRIPTRITVIILYVLIIIFIYLAMTKYVPIILNQSSQLIASLYRFYQFLPRSENEILIYIRNFIDNSNIIDQVKHGASIALNYAKSIGSLGISFVMAFVLSFFYMIEQKQMHQFSKLFLRSPFAWFFKDIHYFAVKFVNTFGVVLEAQFFISLINTTLTTIALAFLGFTQLPSLALMVFLLGLIPVAGVILSCIPLSILSYYEGGIHDVIIILIVITAIHFLESYVLNPKLMSSKTDLPIFYTFVILLVSEQLFGIWGLIVGIPIFTFFLDILGVKPIQEDKVLPLPKQKG